MAFRPGSPVPRVRFPLLSALLPARAARSRSRPHTWLLLLAACEPMWPAPAVHCRWHIVPTAPEISKAPPGAEPLYKRCRCDPGWLLRRVGAIPTTGLPLIRRKARKGVGDDACSCVCPSLSLDLLLLHSNTNQPERERCGGGGPIPEADQPRSRHRSCRSPLTVRPPGRED